MPCNVAPSYGSVCTKQSLVYLLPRRHDTRTLSPSLLSHVESGFTREEDAVSLLCSSLSVMHFSATNESKLVEHKGSGTHKVTRSVGTDKSWNPYRNSAMGCFDCCRIICRYYRTIVTRCWPLPISSGLCSLETVAMPS